MNPLRLQKDSAMAAMPDSYPVKQWYSDPQKNGTYLCKVGEYWWLNPAYPEVRRLVADGVAEILAQYHVDGIHLDDYFYPTTETAFDAAAFADAKADDLGAFRLEQVNAMVQQIYSTVKAASPAMQLSISPQGTMDGNYTKQYADVRAGDGNRLLRCTDSATVLRLCQRNRTFCGDAANLDRDSFQRVRFSGHRHRHAQVRQRGHLGRRQRVVQ
ncbi:MAG: family 10 glycosylhydrolase [Ruminococcus sp.]